MTFDTFGFTPAVAAGIRAAGYAAPTPIQAKAMGPVLEGRDLMGLAQTGTGKTAAFALPILDRLARTPRGPIRALVVAPTRELAEQIHESFTTLGKALRIRSTTIYGGVGMGGQLAALRARPDVVVACPGRLLDHLGRNSIDLTRVEVFVLDEADRMFDMGFLPAVRQIVGRLPAQRQTLLFSATMPPDVERLTREVLRDPVVVRVAAQAPAATVRHALFPVAAEGKTPALLDILGGFDTGPVLVFTRTKHRAKKLAEKLVRSGHRAAALQGNMSQGQRQAALQGFKSGRYDILVATDIAARGIDVEAISHVINYDMPDTVESYTHRIGRTGRASCTGEAFTLVTGEDAALVRAIERSLSSKIERRAVPPRADGYAIDRKTA